MWVHGLQCISQIALSSQIWATAPPGFNCALAFPPQGLYAWWCSRWHIARHFFDTFLTFFSSIFGFWVFYICYVLMPRLVQIISHNCSPFLIGRIFFPNFTPNTIYSKRSKICIVLRLIWKFYTWQKDFFFTGCARGACDKYDVWTHGLLSISNHASWVA